MSAIAGAVLEEYLPDYLNGCPNERYAKWCLRGVLNDNARPRSLDGMPYTAYLTNSHATKPALAARSIIHSIDWESLPADHPLAPNRTGDGLAPDEWRLISEFARIRGKAAHTLQTTDASWGEVSNDEIGRLEDVEDAEQMYHLVYGWKGSPSPLTPPEELEHVSDTPTEALIEAGKTGAYTAARNWEQAESELGLSTLLNEPSLVVDFDHTRYCSRPDRISIADDSATLTAGLYNVEAKTTVRIQPEHVLQAEAQRRAINARTADGEQAHAVLLRLGSEMGDWEIHTSRDDDWLGDEAWDMFRQQAKNLYSDGRVKAALGRFKFGDDR